MERINHQASDSKLAKQIDQYNEAVERHQEAAQAIAEPLCIPDDELVAITIEGVETQRAGLLSERLAHKQNAVALARQRIEIFEATQPELDDRATDAGKAHADCITKTRKKLTTAGVGLESQVAAKYGYPNLAQRQFDAAVRRATPVQQSKGAATIADRQKHQNPKRVREAKEQLVSAVEALRNFVNLQIDPEGVNKNGSERQNRENFAQPHFRQHVSAR